MATAIQRRRGTTLQHANFTGLAGEITIDTTLNTIIVHDGSTAGGIRLAKYAEVQAAAQGDITAVNTLSGSGLTGGVTSGQANIAIDYENLTGNLIPSADNTYSLGSPTSVWKDVYVGPGSLYVNGQKVIEDNSGTIQFSADPNQNISIVTTGSGDIELTTGGEIQLKSNVVLSSGKVITTAGGAPTKFNSNINLDSNNINNLANPVAAQDAATKNYVDTDATVVRVTGTQTIAGAKTFSDDAVFSGNITVSGTTTTVNSETISLADNIIDLNSNFTSGTPTENAGIRIQRGDETAAQLRWNEANDYWETVDGSGATKIALDTDDLAEGSTNLYYTSARANSDFDTKLAAADTDDLTEGSTNQYFTNARARGAISVGGDLSYDSSTGVISFTNDAGDIEGVTAGSGLTGGGTTGTVSLNVGAGDGITVNADDVALASSVAGDGLTFTNGVVDVVGGTGITVAADNVSVNMGAFTTNDLTEGGSNQYFTAARAQAEANIAIADNTTDNLTEGSTNQYFTNARARNAISVSGDLSYNNTSGVLSFTERTDAEVRGLFSAGGDLTYNSSTGVISVTTYKTSDFSTDFGTKDTGDLTEGTNLYYTQARVEGVIDGRVTKSFVDNLGVDAETLDGIDSTNFARTDVAETFASDVTVQGNFTVTGTTTTVNTETINLADNVLLLNSNETGTPSQNGGIEIERGTSTNVSFVWDESADKWTIGAGTLVAGTVEADLTGDVTGTVSSIANHDTDDLSEGSTNVYWTQGRFDTAFAAKSTSDLSEGSNLYHTGARVSAIITADVDKAFVDALNVDADTLDGLDSTYFRNASNLNAGTIPSARLPDLLVSDFAGAAIQTGAEAFADSDTVLMTAAAVQDKIESYGYSTTVGDITGVTAGTGLTGGGTSGSVTLNVSGLTVSEFDGASIQTGAESFADSDTVLMTAAAVQDKILSYGYTTAVGDITGVTAGTGLTGGGSSGSVTLNVDTGAVADGSAAIPTANDVYDFVIGQGYTTNVGDITGVTAGTGLTGGGSSGSVTLNVSGLTVSEFAGGSIQTGSESFSDSDSVLMTAAAVQDKILSYGYTTAVGDITGVTAGTNLTGGGTSGGVTLNLATTLSGMSAATFSGTVSAGLFSGTATSARYADLAEKYATDADYEPGTVVVFGGDAEVTACTVEEDHRVAGVISTDPAYMMNADADGQYVALAGRVPCKVTGPVAKGDLLISSLVPGHAVADNRAPAGRIIGKAIGEKPGEGEGVVEVLVNMM